MSTIEHLTITTPDQEELAARYYSGSENKLIIIAPAVGIPQGYYKHIAHYFSNLGYQLLTFDYRGIGDSRNIKNPESCSLYNWGDLDLNTVIEFVRNNYSSNIYLIGHSIAGQVFPIAKNNTHVKRAYFAASQNLSYSNWEGYHKYLVSIFWHIIIPFFTKINGPLPGFAYGGNKSLPKNVAKDWRLWGITPDGAIGAIPDGKERYAQITTPTKFAAMTDDHLFAPPKAVETLFHSYGSAEKEYLLLNPKEYNMKEIGHFNFFKKDKSALWEDIHLWFEKN
ncbi:alpha/beta hydrolase family protein [Fulvivirga lutea]|uniref:Alpha/beta hydrolase n=1 Tax=Fulvivirga lutea TaxID=2810512 RepID=A0A974WGY1_9BACT|nr:alpha/beta hydrolase [Fulvivirga lutea]QSE97012.1 alpha/beta hydrolase [Fulvivirga lutea]